MTRCWGIFLRIFVSGNKFPGDARRAFSVLKPELPQLNVCFGFMYRYCYN